MLLRILPFSLVRQMPMDVQFFIRDYGDYFLWGIAILLLIRVLRLRRTSSTPSGLPLVLKTFAVNETSADGFAVQIVGRKPGVVAWLLTTLGFDALTTLTVSDDEISFSSSSLYGQLLRLIPLSRISSTLCGYSRPFGCLLLGIIFAALGIFLAFEQYAIAAGGSLFLCGICSAIYWKSKMMLISLTAGGMEPVGLRFRPSVIHGVSIDLTKVAEAVKSINARVVAIQERAHI